MQDVAPPLSHESFYRGLRSIWNTEFPKKCPKCGRVYESFDEYLMDTVALPQSSGLMGYETDEPGQQVGLFRNCPCGTTILAFCHDRRDMSAAGDQRRAMFGELLDRLVETGLAAHVARERLLVALRTSPDVSAFRNAA